MTKKQIVRDFILRSPQEAIAAVMRDKMTQKPPQEENNTTPVAWGVSFGVAVLAGIVLGVAYANSTSADRVRYRDKAKSLLDSIADTLSPLTDQVADTLTNASKTIKAKASTTAEQTEAVEEAA